MQAFIMALVASSFNAESRFGQSPSIFDLVAEEGIQFAIPIDACESSSLVAERTVSRSGRSGKFYVCSRPGSESVHDRADRYTRQLRAAGLKVQQLSVEKLKVLITVQNAGNLYQVYLSENDESVLEVVFSGGER